MALARPSDQDKPEGHLPDADYNLRIETSWEGDRPRRRIGWVACRGPSVNFLLTLRALGRQTLSGADGLGSLIPNRRGIGGIIRIRRTRCYC